MDMNRKQADAIVADRLRGLLVASVNRDDREMSEEDRAELQREWTKTLEEASVEGETLGFLFIRIVKTETGVRGLFGMGGASVPTHMMLGDYVRAESNRQMSQQDHCCCPTCRIVEVEELLKVQLEEGGGATMMSLSELIQALSPRGGK